MASSDLSLEDSSSGVQNIYTEKDAAASGSADSLSKVEKTKSRAMTVVDIAAKDDEALKYADADVTLDPKMARTLVWKADLYICTMMSVVYAIQYMDKTSNGSAAIMGIIPDLKMDGKMYSWVGSSFYLGYLIFEIPVNIVLQKLPLARTTSVFIILWGVVLAASAACTNYSSYITTRVLLGILEAAITPSFLVVTSQWYKRDEQYSRVLVWFAWNGVGAMVGSGISLGFFLHAQNDQVAPWRLIFLTFGLITIVLGMIFYIHMPDSPSTAWFLSEEERAGQVQRIKENMQGYGTHQIKWDQVRETFIDPRTYLIASIVLLAQIPNGGLTNFSSILFKGMGYDTRMVMLIGVASGAVELVGCVVTAVATLYILRGYRLIYAAVSSALTFMCCALLAWGRNNETRLAGVLLFTWIAPVGYIALLSSIASNSAGTTKKYLSSAILLIAYCVGNLVGPQTFKPKEAPTYQTAKVAMAACTAVNVLLYTALLFLNIWENRRRDRKNEKLPANLLHKEFADLTDMQNPEFRYAL